MNLDNDKIILEEIEKEDAFDPANRENKVQDEIYERGIFYNLLMSLKENKLAIICLIILIIIIIASLLAPLSSYD